MVAVSTLISPPSVFYQFFKINLWDFLSSQVALWVTIFVSVEAGIAAGVGFSLVVLLFRVARPNFHVLRQLKNRPDVFIDASVDSTLDTIPAPHGILVFRIEESTTFPNTETFKTWVVDETYKYTRFGGKVKSVTERQWSDDLEVHIRGLRKIAHGAESNITDDDLPRLRAVVLDFSAVNNIDSTGLQGLFDLREILKDYAGVADYPAFFFELHFVGIQANVLRILELSGITRPVGPIALQKVQVLDHDDSSNSNSASPLSRSSTNQNGEIRHQDFDSDDGSEIRNADDSQSSITKGGVASAGGFKVESTKERPVPGDIGAAALSVNGLGSSPFLKEEGLVHLTVRDAIDSILVRSSQWEGGVSVDEEERSSEPDKTDIHYV